jgi:hypothetical protein
MLPLAQDGLKMAHVIPQMAGATAPQTYLIIAQNDDELRATGGFITGVGVLTVDNGRIQQLAFQDAVLVDTVGNGLYDYPPAPLQQCMGLDYFVFRDANYWPDFPTSAENAIHLYALGQNLDPASFDGVIAIDQPLLELLVEGTGPIPINESDLTLTGDNIIDILRDTWVSQAEAKESEQNWLFSRKDFMSIFAGEIRNRIENDIGSVDPLTLGRNMYQAGRTKRLQLYFRDPEIMAVLQEINWDGRLENIPQQDFLMVADTNMGYNKANIYIDRALTYDLILNEEGTGDANLTVTHNHRGPASDSVCQQDTADEYAVAQNYIEIADQCYFNYLRLFTPEQTVLTSSTKQEVGRNILISGLPWEGTAQASPEISGFNTFGNFMVLPRAQSIANSFQYHLPATIVQSDSDQSIYRLQIQKQAGMNPEAVQISITLPPGTQLVEANLTPTKVVADQVIFQFDLTEDLLLEVVYQ